MLLGWQDRPYSEHPIRPVHRIDRLTSGINLFGKDKLSTRFLSKLFQPNKGPLSDNESNTQPTRKLEKWYLIAVEGLLPVGKTGTINLPINDRPVDEFNYRVEVDSPLGGKSALTEYAVLAASNELSFILVKPRTGRRYQIRAHFAHIGYPILNDPQYNPNCADRNALMHLHAYKLFIPGLRDYFKNPSLPKELMAPIPPHFQETLRGMGCRMEDFCPILSNLSPHQIKQRTGARIYSLPLNSPFNTLLNL